MVLKELTEEQKQSRVFRC